jgi:hypothetical protein
MAKNCNIAEGHPLPAGWGVTCDTAIWSLSFYKATSMRPHKQSLGVGMKVK